MRWQRTTAVRALALAVAAAGCFRAPTIDGSKLECKTEDNCLPGHVCDKAVDSADGYGRCVRFDPKAARGDASDAWHLDAQAASDTTLDLRTQLDGDRPPDGAAGPAVDGLPTGGDGAANDVPLVLSDAGLDDAPLSHGGASGAGGTSGAGGASGADASGVGGAVEAGTGGGGGAIDAPQSSGGAAMTGGAVGSGGASNSGGVAGGGGSTGGTQGTGGTIVQSALLVAPMPGLEMGQVSRGGTKTSTFAIQNAGEETSGQITVTSDSAEFVALKGGAGDCAGATLGPGASCTVRVAFTPAALGARSATVAFSASPGGTGNVNAAGIGVDCPPGSHDGGDGSCVPTHSCSPGYHHSGSGKCVVNADCPANQLTDDTGTCVAMAGVNWSDVDATYDWKALAICGNGKLIGAKLGPIYASNDLGRTWEQLGAPAAGWSMVGASADCTHLMAGIGRGSEGKLHVSTDSGSTWQSYGPTLDWSAIAVSADGSNVVATTESTTIHFFWKDPNGLYGYTSNPGGPSSTESLGASADLSKLVAGSGGTLSTSTDSGVTWTSRLTASSGSRWRSVASSKDGVNLFATDGKVLYASPDSGVNWTGPSPATNWTTLGTSSDGRKLVAGACQGHLYTSTDSAQTWSARAESRCWRAVVIAPDGTRMAAIFDHGIASSSGPAP